MTIRYRVDIENTLGEKIITYTGTGDGFISLSYSPRISDKGNYQLTLSGFDPRVRLIKEDYLIRVYMDDNAEGIVWLNVFNGIHKTFTDQQAENGNETFTSFGPSLEEILDKSYILYTAGSAQAEKSAVSSTAMYEFVKENVGSLATLANGRQIAGTNPITNGVDSGEGPLWDDTAPWKNLLVTLKKIREYSISQDDQIDFSVSYLGAYTFQFNAGKLGTDRTTAGLSATSNGLNGAGYPPVIFGPLQGNVESYIRSKSRFNEANTVLALGQGTGALRDTASAQDALAATVSPIAQREMVTNAVNSTDTAKLQTVADAKLEERKADEKFTFTPRRGAQILWRDYFIGDFITGEDKDGNRTDKQVIGADINVSATSGALIERTVIKFADM